MKVQQTTIVLTVGIFLAICSQMSYANDVCVSGDCSDCIRDCSEAALFDPCENDCINKLKVLLCDLLVIECNERNQCPRTNVQLYPAIDYNDSQDAWIPKNVSLAPNSCLNLEGKYYKTTTGIKFESPDDCVILYSNLDCTGQQLEIEGSWPEECLKFIDCDARIAAGGIPFNDETASLSTC